MKNLTYLLLLCFMFAGIALISCGGDDDEEFFVTNDDATAKEMVKGNWKVQSVTMKTNYSETGIDKLVNKEYQSMLKKSTLTMSFGDEFVKSITTERSTGNIVSEENDKYYFGNNRLYIEDQIYHVTLSQTYKVSNKTLILLWDFTKADFTKVLQIGGAEELIASIPSNLSGTLSYTLKKY
ncbi:hypothetical protein [Viscerimonas tarda]